MSKDMHIIMTFNTRCQIALWKGCTSLALLWSECPLLMASLTPGSYCLKGMLENCWYPRMLSNRRASLDQQPGAAAATLSGIFQAFIDFCWGLMCSLVIWWLTDSTEYLIMLKDILVSEDKSIDLEILFVPLF